MSQEKKETKEAAGADTHEKLMALLKRRGFLQPSYEIYGGIAGFYDYGPLGAALKTNIENLWRRFFVLNEGMAEIQCPTISPEQVFRASGHLEKFADTVIECPECGVGSRGDHLVRGEWKRIMEEIRPLLIKSGFRKIIPTLESQIALIVRNAEQAREKADRDPSPESLTGLLHGTSAPFKAQKDQRFMFPDSLRNQVLWQAAQILDNGRLLGYMIAHARGIEIFRPEPLTGQLRLLAGEYISCPACRKPLDVDRSKSRPKISAFNLMFETSVGPGSGRIGYLRPETAQGIFMDFAWLSRYFRGQMPFGVVQIGKAYRNEISPRQSLLRLREFHQMEAEVFFDPLDKNWPRYSRLVDKELTLMRREAQTPIRMRMGEAVEKGIIANGALGYFVALTAEFLEAAGLPTQDLRFRQHGLQEKAHYATDTWDAEFQSSRFGWVEIVGIADRTDYDLRAHEQVSGQKLRQMRLFTEPREEEIARFIPIRAKLGPLFKEKASVIVEAMAGIEVMEPNPEVLKVDVGGQTFSVPKDCFRIERRREKVDGEWYVPHVIEPSFGVDRIIYAVLERRASFPGPEIDIMDLPAGKQMKVIGPEPVTIRLPPTVAPIKVGVFPLMARDGLDDLARDVDSRLRSAGIATFYDDAGAIGRRYARMDEVGTPWCVTVDYESLEKKDVTVRERDTTKQERIAIADLVAHLSQRT